MTYDAFRIISCGWLWLQIYCTKGTTSSRISYDARNYDESQVFIFLVQGSFRPFWLSQQTAVCLYFLQFNLSQKTSICWDSATKRRNTKASGQNVALGSPKNSFQKSKYKIFDTMTLLWHDRGNWRIEHV